MSLEVRVQEEGFILLEGLISLVLLLLVLVTLHGFWMRMLHRDWRQEVMATRVLVDFVQQAPAVGADSLLVDQRVWQRICYDAPDSLGNTCRHYVIVGQDQDSLVWQRVQHWGRHEE